jgi:diacylglycerol O-acyltransferase / wax synthase
MSSTMNQRMGAFDAVMWNVESDPVLRSVIVAMLVLDSPPDVDAAIDRIDRMTLAVPKLRQRVVGNPVSMVPPRWVVDENFDLGYHLRWVAAPRRDRSLRPALELAQTMAEQDFDRKRPLWEMTLMTGLPRNQAALLVKIHHSITDGMGGLAMAAAMLDLAAEPGVAPGARPAPPQPERLGLTERLTSGVAFEARRVATTSKSAVGGIGGLAARMLRDPRQTTLDSTAFAASAARLLAPASTPESPTLTARSLSGHFDYFACPFDDLKRAAKAHGGTINDVFLAIVTRGLYRYHRRHGADVTGLRVNMPINLRTGVEDAQGGNRWVPARVVVPVDVADPGDHIRALGPILKQARTEPALVLSDQVYRFLVRMPTAAATAVSAGLMKGTDVAATNLPGPPVPVYFAGSRVTALLPFAPRAGAALNVSLMTYDGRGFFAVNIDERAAPDADALVDDLRAALTDVLNSAG